MQRSFCHPCSIPAQDHLHHLLIDIFHPSCRHTVDKIRSEAEMLFNVTNPYSSAKQFADKKSVIKNNQQNEARCNFTETRIFNHDIEQKNNFKK